jgi:1-deoxy-D-xylulose-5-phosphate synthase
LCVDRAGLVGEDGATHHGAFDMAYFRCIPGLTIASPMNEEELRNLLYTAQLANKGPIIIRYPKGPGVTADWRKPFKEITVGKGRMIREGKDIAILTIGPVGNFVMEACTKLAQIEIEVAHYDLRFLKPLDKELLHEVFKKHSLIITVEDGVISGGFGSAILEFMADNGYNATVKRLGIPDNFVEHGTQAELYKQCGYDVLGIVDTVKKCITKPKP